MEKKKYKLKGHESFVLREGWLTKGLRAVYNDNRVFSHNAGADALGVGTNMAKAIRYWLKASKLIVETPSKGSELTPLGKLIFDNDLYFEDIFSLWVIHTNIASNYEMATSWNLFFNFMDITSGFSREEMFELMRTLFQDSTGVQEVSDRSLRDDCAAIISMYSSNNSWNEDPEELRNSPFEVLGLMGRNSNKYVKKKPMLDTLDPLLILYCFIEQINVEGSVQIDFLTEGENMPGHIFNLNRILINGYLDALQSKGYITVNRTAGLDIVYPAKCEGLTKEDLVQKYFERK